MIFCAIFDMKTGKVTGISNNPDPTSTHVEISRELYSKFVNVEEDINNYIVINENKKYQIIKKGKEFVEEVANENVIPLKKFFKLQDSMNIFQIVQDKERWYAYGKFTDDYMKYLITNPNLFARDRILYLTEKNDARKLLETCQISVEKFIDNSVPGLNIKTSEQVDIFMSSSDLEFIHVVMK